MSRKPSLVIFGVLLAAFILVLPAATQLSSAPAVVAESTPETQVAARCGKCGDGQCVRSCGETPETCPVDCGISSPKRAE